MAYAKKITSTQKPTLKRGVDKKVQNAQKVIEKAKTLQDIPPALAKKQRERDLTTAKLRRTSTDIDNLSPADRRAQDELDKKYGVPKMPKKKGGR